MNDLYFCNPVFDPNPYITKCIDEPNYTPTASDLALFDQNGYDLTELERKYYNVLEKKPNSHRNKFHHSLRKPWFLQNPINEKDVLECIRDGEDPFAPWKNLLQKNTGAVLNHAFLLERKGYKGDALNQLKAWSVSNPLVYKLINYKPKWGIDFSIDYVGNRGDTFEIFHYEWDSFDYEEAKIVKNKLEKIILETNWDVAALELLKRKNEWHHLDFFSQSEWKCNFFGIAPEKFKMVAWD